MKSVINTTNNNETCLKIAETTLQICSVINENWATEIWNSSGNNRRIHRRWHRQMQISYQITILFYENVTETSKPARIKRETTLTIVVLVSVLMGALVASMTKTQMMLCGLVVNGKLREFGKPICALI